MIRPIAPGFGRSLAAFAAVVILIADVAAATAQAKGTASSTSRKSGVAPAAKPAAADPKTVMAKAREARELEDTGAYGAATKVLRALRGLTRPDADLELALALDEARVGAVDSAWSRLSSPLLLAAARETLPVARFREYPYQREPAWLNGRFDGWHWYVWRARAEVAAATGRWSEAYEAALNAALARPVTGKEWLALAVSASRLGHEVQAREAGRHAALLDPTLPEARYLIGLWEWRAGKRSDAQALFREAVALDSAFVPAALALVRSRLPGAKPDSLPNRFLTGARQIGLLTSPLRPKPEEFVQVDVPASISYSPDTPVADSLIPGVKPVRLALSLLIDESGRPVLNDIPWFPPGQIPPWKIHRLLVSVPSWRFTPAIRLGSPHPVWASLEFEIQPMTAVASHAGRRERP